MDLDWLRPVASGVVGGLVVWLLARAGRKPAPRNANVRELTYGSGFRVFTIALVPGSLFVAYAAAHARNSQLLLASCVAAVFLAAAVFFVYQVFFVRLAYDDESVYYRSPLSGSHRIPWTDVLEVGYSGLMQSHYLRTEKVPRIWCSNMLQGYEELGAFLSQKADQLFGGDET